MSLKKKIIKKIESRLIKELKLRNANSILVAFSGGADSVSLLYILNSIKEKAGFSLYAAHLNHNLRGEAADNDEAFAREFCEKLGVELFVKKEDVRAYAKEHKLSEELAGRELRYSFFEQIMREKNISLLATGHHGDDQAETVIMHLMRGSGIDGISGMRYSRDNIIRPLLDVSKDEIFAFCKEEGIGYCTDATNFETDYSRNKVRLELLPKMQEFNPNIAGTISRTARVLADESDFLDEYADGVYKDIVKDNSVELSKLLDLHMAIRRRIVRKMTEKAAETKKDISYDYVDKTLALVNTGKTGKSINLLSDVTARVEYGNLIIEREYELSDFSYKMSIGEEQYIDQTGVRIKICEDENGDFQLPENGNLILRTRQNGDRVYPLGMNGSKKLKDFFIDEKIPRHERNKSLILTCDGEIVMVFYCDKCFYDRRFYKKNNGNARVKIIKERI